MITPLSSFASARCLFERIGTEAALRNHLSWLCRVRAVSGCAGQGIFHGSSMKWIEMVLSWIRCRIPTCSCKRMAC